MWATRYFKLRMRVGKMIELINVTNETELILTVAFEYQKLIDAGAGFPAMQIMPEVEGGPRDRASNSKLKD